MPETIKSEMNALEELNLLIEEVGLGWVILAGVLSIYVIYRILQAISIIPGGAVKAAKPFKKSEMTLKTRNSK